MSDWTDLWRQQPVTPARYGVEEIREKAARFQDIVARRNRREYLAAAFVIVVFSLFAWFTSDLWLRIGSMLTALGSLCVAWQIHRRAGVGQPPGQLGLEATIAFHRKELEHQRDLLRSVGTWYLGPLVPGMAVFQIGRIRHHPSQFWVLVVMALCLAGVWWLNQRAAAALDQQIRDYKEYE